MNDQIAVVTGAGRGIGKAIALRFAEEGANVVCLSRTESNAESAAEAVRAKGRRAWAFSVDISDTLETQEAAKAILKETGRVDILVNNAGVTRDDLLMRMSEEAWDTVLDTNLKGAFSMCKAFTRTFMKQRQGRIINISSVIGLMGNAGQTNYAASKAGLIGLTKSIARELAVRNVTCNAIAPGLIKTYFAKALWDNPDILEQSTSTTPLKRIGLPDEIAGAAVFLASDAGAFMTGQQLVIDGGQTIA